MENQIKIVAALQIVFSILGLITALIIYLVLHIVGNFSDDYQANMVLSIIANGIAVFFTIIALPGIIGGIGLLKRKEWARILVLIISVLDLFNFPLGTAVGVYSIWVLAQNETVEIFKKNKVEVNPVE